MVNCISIIPQSFHAYINPRRVCRLAHFMVRYNWPNSESTVMLHDAPMIATWSLFHINNFQPPQCGSAKWHRPHDILSASLQMAGCVSKALRKTLGHRPSCGRLRAQPGWLNMGRKLSDIFQGQIRSQETTRNVRWHFTSVWSIWLMYDIFIHISWSSRITLPSLGPRFRRLKRSRATRQAKSMSFSAISSRLRGSKMGSVTCHRRMSQFWFCGW